MSKTRIIIIVSILIAFTAGGGTGYLAHDCGEQEPIKVKLGLDGTVPVEVTCTSEPVTVEVTCACDTIEARDEGPCENPPLIFEIEPAWNAGFAIGSHAVSADFTWNIKKSRFDPYIQALYISDYSKIQKDRTWGPTMVSDSDWKALIGVRYSGRTKRVVSTGN
jgi:hypothetical protein